MAYDTKEDDFSASSASASFGEWIDKPDESKDQPFNTWSGLAEFTDCVFLDAGLNNGFCARLEELKCSSKSAEEIADELDLMAAAAEGAAIDTRRLARTWRDRTAIAFVGGND